MPVDSPWVILQFLHPMFHVPVGYDLEGNQNIRFRNPNWQQFVKACDDSALQHYHDQHEDAPFFGLLWLGRKMAQVVCCGCVFCEVM